MKVFVVVPLFCAVLLFVGLPEILADTASNATLHEVWSDCDGLPGCQYTCDRPDDRFDVACPRICLGGNICEEGYLRQSNVEGSACILPADCPPNSICVEGNICENGYVREPNAENAACILLDDCPPN